MTISEAMLALAMSAGNPTPVTVPRLETRPCYISTITSTEAVVSFNPVVNTTERTVLDVLQDKIKGFRTIENSDFVLEKPSQTAEEKSLDLADFFYSNGINIHSVLAMADGGISFNFYTRSCQHAIEVYNDGDVVYSKKVEGEDSVIRDLTLGEVMDELDSISPYGD